MQVSNSTSEPISTDAPEAVSADGPTKVAGRQFSGLVLIMLTLASAGLHGILDGRWSSARDLRKQGARLAELPERCGDWRLADKQTLDEGAAALLRCFGSEVRVYRHTQTDAAITVALLFGPRGPIAVHTPEICYSSVGTTQTGTRQARSLTTADGLQRLWMVQFSQGQTPEPALEVWYGWSDGGPWQARDYPRFWPTDALYKIQIAGPVGEDADQPCRDFLEAFLPQVEGVIE
jgi:hypothetical protein